MNSWLPAAKGLLDMVVEKLPSPVVAQRNRLGLLWPHSKPDNVEGAEAWLRMKNAMENCDSSEGSPFIAFVSKMIQKPEDGSQPKIRQPKPREVTNKAVISYRKLDHPISRSVPQHELSLHERFS